MLISDIIRESEEKTQGWEVVVLDKDKRCPPQSLKQAISKKESVATVGPKVIQGIIGLVVQCLLRSAFLLDEVLF